MIRSSFASVHRDSGASLPLAKADPARQPSGATGFTTTSFATTSSGVTIFDVVTLGEPALGIMAVGEPGPAADGP